MSATTTAMGTQSTVERAEISVEGVWQQYQRLGASEPFIALRDITLPIEDGKFVAAIGTSGCGKSTPLRIVAGLVTPTQRQVIRAGRRVKGPDSTRGFVFQADAVFPWLTVRQNVEFGLKSRGMGRTERREIAEKWCEIVGLSDFINAYPKELSGGMRK